MTDMSRSQVKAEYGRFAHLFVGGIEWLLSQWQELTGGAETDLHSHAASGGSDPNAVQYVDVQLTNTQVTTLRASPVEVLPAPGAGFAYIPEGDSWELYDVMNAGWTLGAGNDTQGRIGLLGIGDNAGDLVATWFDLDNDSMVDSGLIVVSTHAQGASQFFPRNDNRVSNYDNCSLIITNAGAFEYGGGDPVNTVSLRIGYRLVPTVPFGA